MLDDDDWDGDLDLLPVSARAGTCARVAADSDRCAWRACAFYQDATCAMRERRAQAQVIVVNHTLLLLDAAMGGFLLPERDLMVIDEAHHLEEEATRAFTITVTPGRVRSLLAHQRAPRTATTGTSRRSTMPTPRPGMRCCGWGPTRGRQQLPQPIRGLRLADTLTDLAVSLQPSGPLNRTRRRSSSSSGW